MKRLIDQEIRDQIAHELDVNLCVEAGAGTGKTTSLVARIVQLLATGCADVDSLAVITFTEKAAAELSSRVREEIGKAVDTETDADRHERLETARKGLYRAHIETIHSFARALLSERPVEAGLDPEFEMLVGLEADFSFDDAYNRWLDGLMASGDEGVGRALNLGLTLEDIRGLAETVDSYRFMLPLTAFDAPTPDVGGFVASVTGTASELSKLAADCTDETDVSMVNLQAALAFSESLADAGESDAARERFLLSAKYRPKGKSSGGNKNNWADPASLASVRELNWGLHEALCEFQNDLRTAAMLGVLPRIEEFLLAYTDERRRRGRPDFDDLLIWARDLLRDDLPVRKYFQARFSHLLIDEFQDTDPIQVEIALLLTSDGQDGKTWRELEPAAGKLFVVGDPKQSIYRFRRADIAIYDEVKREIMADGLRQIVQNFRSLSGVLDWVNKAFNLLLEEVPGVQPANEPLIPSGAELELGRSPVIMLHGGGDDLNADGIREAEAAGVSALLHEAVVEERWEVRDRVTGEIRAASWGDIAVLMPTRTGLEAYEEAMAAAGIPHRHAGSRDYFKRQEVRDLVLILRAIDDPGDHFSVVGALRSAAFACSDAELVIHRAGDGERLGTWNYRAPNTSESPQVATAFEVLSDLYQARGRLSLPELVRTTIERSHLVEFALTLPDGPQAAANLLAIADQAQRFSSAGGGGLRAFTRWLDDSTEQEVEEVDAGITEEADEVVRLMTIHGAKGLEFPIVVLGNLGSKGGARREPVVKEDEGRLYLQVGTKNRGYYSTPGYEERWEAEKVVQEAEQIRLLYVAATRARDHLIVPDFRGKRSEGSSPLAKLADVLPDSAGHQIEVDGLWLLDAAKLGVVDLKPEVPDPATKKEIAAALAERDAWEADHTALIKNARRELPFTVASSVERSTRPLSSEVSSSASALLLSEGPPIPIGDALHQVMERVSLPDADDLDEVVEAACLDGGIEDHAADITELAKRCLASPTVVRAIESGDYQREVPFTVPDGEGGFLTGRIDLLFQDGDEYVVVDYKTDAVEADAVAAHVGEQHAGQATVYRTGIGKAGSVRSCVFVYCRPGSEALLEFSDELERP